LGNVPGQDGKKAGLKIIDSQDGDFKEGKSNVERGTEEDFGAKIKTKEV